MKLYIVSKKLLSCENRLKINVHQWLTRGKKVNSRGEREIWKQFLPFREGKEKSEFLFPSFEKRKRNLKIISLISRGERKSWIPFPQFREEKEKSNKIFLTFEKRKRNCDYISTISRREREYWNSSFYFESKKRKVK